MSDLEHVRRKKHICHIRTCRRQGASDPVAKALDANIREVILCYSNSCEYPTVLKIGYSVVNCSCGPISGRYLVLRSL